MYLGGNCRWVPLMNLHTVILRELLLLQKWSKNFRYRITSFWGVILTPNLTPNLGPFSLLKKSSFYSQCGVKISPKWGYFYSLQGLFYSFWS